MSYFISGLGYGLWLAVMVGPLVFALIQTTIEKGTKAGLTIGLGIWLSDALFILAFLFAADSMEALTSYENFELIVSAIGGLILFSIGAGMYLKTPTELPKASFKASQDLLANGIKGFSINTFNPFTFVFWLAIVPTRVKATALTPNESLIFVLTILGVIILTDSLKVAFAKKLQPKLTLQNITAVRKISGAALVIFGIVLIIKVII